MTPHRIVACLLALCLVATPALGASTIAIDADHGLATEDAIETFDREEVASADLAAFDATITVAESHDDVGLDGAYVDTNKVYVRFDYDESLTRTVRVYLPAAMATPRLKEDLESESGSVTADFSPTDRGDYLAMTVRVTEPTDAVFALSKEAGLIWHARDVGHDAVNDTTGVDLPTLSSSADWRFTSNLSQQQSVAIDGRPDSLTLQYDAEAGPGREWLSVPECSDPAEQPVCYYGKGNQTIVMTAHENPPTVRYQLANNPIADLKSGLRDLGRVPERIMDQLDSLFGGD